MRIIPALQLISFPLFPSYTHSSLWPSQRQPSLSQPACHRQTVLVNDSGAAQRWWMKKKKVIKGRGAVLIMHTAFVRTARYLLRMWASSLVTTLSVTARPQCWGVQPGGGRQHRHGNTAVSYCRVLRFWDPLAQQDTRVRSLDNECHRFRAFLHPKMGSKPESPTVIFFFLKCKMETELSADGILMNINFQFVTRTASYCFHFIF